MAGGGDEGGGGGVWGGGGGGGWCRSEELRGMGLPCYCMSVDHILTLCV